MIVVGQKSGTPWNNFVGFVDGVYLTATGTNATTHIDNLNASGDPVTATVISGGGQSTVVNTAFAPLVLELRDADNALVENGTQVTISVPGAGASAVVTPVTATVTGGTGQVTFNATANGSVGSYAVNVTNILSATLTGTTFTNTAAIPPTTVLVFPADVNGLAGDNTDFWNVDYYDTNVSTDNPVGSISRTTNAATNGGYASFEFYVGEEAGTNSGNPAGCQPAGGKTWFGTTKLAGMTLRDLDQLSFSEMVKTLGIGDPTPNLLPYVNIFFDINNDGQWLPGNDGILVFNGNLGSPYVLGQWYDTGDLAASGSTRLWNFAVKSPLPGNFGLNTPVLNYRNMMSQTVDVSVLGGTTVGDLKIVNPVGGCVGTPTSTEGTGNSFTFVFGQKNGGGYNGMVAHVDSIVLTTSGGGSLDINNFYDITNYGPATTITATSGSGQSTLISTAFTNPLVATVTDALGNLVPGESVTFTVPGAGASAAVTSPLVTGLLNGQVSTPATANATVGSYVVTANITPPLPTAASFALTNFTPGVTITQSGTTDVTEGGTTDTYTVVLNSAPASPVTVQLSFGSQILVSTDGVTFVASPVSLTFTTGNWNVAQTITVQAVDDLIVEGAHIDTVTHATTSADANYNALTVASVTVNIADNDTAGVTVTQSGGTTNVTEGGATDTYTVVLNTTPANSVTVQLSFGSQILVSTDGVTFVASPVSLTFTTGNWNVAQTITVQAVDDLIVEGAHSDTITHATTSADANYNALTVASVTANITDNDTASPTELLINGSFNADAGSPQPIPTAWEGRSLTRDSQKCATTGKDFDGPCYLVFNGNTGERGRFFQIIDVSGLSAGQTITLTASANAKGGARGVIEMVVAYPISVRAPSNAARSQIRWETNTVTYTTKSVSHILVDAPVSIKVRVRSLALTGKWFVDGVSLSLNSTRALGLPDSN